MHSYTPGKCGSHDIIMLHKIVYPLTVVKIITKFTHFCLCIILMSRTLSELNSKVEASSKMVAQLQAKLAEEHDQVLEERTQRNKAHESQLKS